MTTKISVIHPSRGRVLMAYNCFMEWMTNASSKHSIEYIFSVDQDDPDLEGYLKIVSAHQKKHNIQIVISDNKNVVDAMNSGAEESNGNVLVGISDDFKCFENWDEWILKNISIDIPEALKINDGLQPTSNIIMTMPILNRKLYEQLGFVYFPEYTGIFADNDLAERCIALHCFKVNNSMVFNHRHWVTGAYKKDATNERHDCIKGWEIGRKVLTEQRLKNFGVKKTYA